MQRDTDLHAWALEQTRLLREHRFDRLDIDGIADEIEDVGKSEQRELASRMGVLLAQLLKWAWQSERHGPSWQTTIRAQRKEIRYALKESPSLVPKLDDAEWVDMVWARAVAITATETSLSTFPADCPWQLKQQVLNESWLPDSR